MSKIVIGLIDLLLDVLICAIALKYYPSVLSLVSSVYLLIVFTRWNVKSEIRKALRELDR